MPRSVLRIGTRSSALALAQAETVRQAVQQVITKRNFELVPMITEAEDAAQDKFLPLGRAGMLTGTLEDALAEGKIDLAVHNAKDLPLQARELVVMAAITERMDPRDALLTRRGSGLSGMIPGTRVGVSSRRRAFQIAEMQKGFVPMPFRGNLDIRMRGLTAGEVDVLLVTVAALRRLGKADRISEILPIDVMLPGPGQGSLAVQCRATDKDMRAALAQIEHAPSRRVFDTERAWLETLRADASMPVAAIAKLDGTLIKLRAAVGSEDGREVLRDEETGEDPVKVGRVVAERMIDSGAGNVLRVAASA